MPSTFFFDADGEWSVPVYFFDDATGNWHEQPIEECAVYWSEATSVEVKATELSSIDQSPIQSNQIHHLPIIPPSSQSRPTPTDPCICKSHIIKTISNMAIIPGINRRKSPLQNGPVPSRYIPSSNVVRIYHR